MSRAIAYGEKFSADLVVLSRFALPVATDVAETAVTGVVDPVITTGADNGIALNGLRDELSVFRLIVRGTIFSCFRLMPGEVIDAISSLLFSKSESPPNSSGSLIEGFVRDTIEIKTRSDMVVGEAEALF